MKLNLANKFLILGVLLYILAGIAAIGKMKYSLVVLAAATIFLASGFFANVRFRWGKLFKKKV